MAQYNRYFDIGGYVGNGGQYRVGIPTLRNQGASAGAIAQSLRFRAANSNYLNRTFSAGNQKTWTWSAWIKIGGTLATNYRGLFRCGTSYFGIGGVGFSDSFWLNHQGTWSAHTTLAFKDTAKWYHLMVVLDTTQATDTNRFKVYVDGQQTSIVVDGGSLPTLNSDGPWNAAAAHNIGLSAASVYYDGHFADHYFIDGQALTPSSFGEYNSDNIWVPKAYSGTYGTNGYSLKFASGAVGTDSSGNGNTWTLNGFNVTTANTTYDIVTDSPTDYNASADTGVGGQVRGNYATLNPNSTSGGTVDYGGLRATGPSSWRRYATFLPVNSGKWYWEATHIGTAYSPRGTNTAYKGMGWQVVSDTNSTSYPHGSSLTNCIIYADNGYYQNFTSSSSDGGSTISNGDVMGMAVDLDNNTFTIYRNNVSVASGSMGAGRVAGSYMWPVVWSYDGSYGSLNCNFGQMPFAYTAPSGYKAICTANLTRPADSSLWFYGDTPDLMWIKNRSTTGLHTITDTVRGMGLAMTTSTQNADTSYPGVTEMNKFGMSIINDATSILNGSTNTIAYWAWKAGGLSTVTNTSGSITSQVSANRLTGFSIVSYTGTGANGTVGHGLGTAPSFIVCKRRMTALGDWQTYHISSGATNTLKLNGTGANITASIVWNNTSPTSSVFSLGSGGDANLSGDPYVAYCWAPIPGYSAFGSYTGNGSADGPFVYTGFRPRWVLLKNSSASATDWEMFDSWRDYTGNPMQTYLTPNGSSAESAASGAVMDFLSNGFKLRSSASTWNGSTNVIVYAAFAENPFKFARAK